MKRLIVTIMVLMELLVLVSGCNKETPTSEKREQKEARYKQNPLQAQSSKPSCTDFKILSIRGVWKE